MAFVYSLQYTSSFYFSGINFQTSYSFSALLFFLFKISQHWGCVCLSLPLIRFNWIFKFKWSKLTGGVIMFFETRPLAGFKIALFLHQKIQVIFSVEEGRICRCCEFVKTSPESLTANLYPSPPSPGQNVKSTEKGKISRCLKGFVPLISGLTT